MVGHKLVNGVLAVLLLVSLSACAANTGNVAEAGLLNAQKIAQALVIPTWEQVNANGFGDPKELEVSALETFNGYLYAGSYNVVEPLVIFDGARIFRSPDGVTWTAVTQPGFQNPHDSAPPAILDFVVFGTRLYASTGRGGNPAQIWRTTTGTSWSPMVTAGFGDQDIHDIPALAVFNGMIYAGAGSQVSGAKLYRSSSGDSNTWTPLTPAASTMAGAGVSGFEVFNSSLYATVESEAPVQIWRSSNGSTWTVAMSNGFGNSQTTSSGGMAVFGGYLYVGVGNAVNGAQLWRSNNGTNWTSAITPGFGDANNKTVEMVSVFQNQLYVGVQNDQTGIEIWRSADGNQWEQVNQDGFGDSHNTTTNGSHAAAEFLSQLYVGTSNIVTGAELWRMLPLTPPTYLLTVSKSGTGSGTVTSDPAGINCGLDCSEAYPNSTIVTLTAAPAAGSTFDGWSGDADCSDGQVTLDAPRTCSATFNDPSLTQGANITIGTQFIGTYPVLSNPSTIISQPNLVDGPVRVTSAKGANLFTSERVVSGDSFNEVMGYPTNQLTTEYWFPWYDNISMDTWVLVGNASSTQAAAVDIYIGGVKRGSYTIPIGGRVTPRFNIPAAGPVRVVSTNGALIFTSERTLYGLNNSFNEVMGYPANQFTTEYWFPWYDNKDMSTWILVGNPSTTATANVDIYIGGVKRGSYSIPKGGNVTPRFGATQAGPVRVVSTNGVKIFSSERTVTLSGDSFNEVMGYPASQFNTEYWYPWYDNVGMMTWVLVGNPTGSAAAVDIYVGGVKRTSTTIPAGGRIMPRYTGLNTGPVRVVCTNGVKIFTSERVLYGSSFNEVMGYPGNKLTTEYWFPWYDSKSMSTDILVGIP